MKYPKFLKKNATIGICAPSAGAGNKLEEFERSLEHLKRDYQIIESPSVRVDGIRSNTDAIRGQEVNDIYLNPDVDFVMCAKGGDFLFETLPYIDFEALASKPKWFLGASDPTSILYTLTTKYDIATMYGFGAGSFDGDYDYIQVADEFLKGNLIKQNSYKYSQKVDFDATEIIFDQEVKWLSTSDINVKGRLIGGCVDVLKDLIGTKYDGTKDFISRYQTDGIIWYFDNFAMSAENFYRTMLQMRYAGYFENTKAVIVGRVCFESSETGMSYEEAMALAFKDIPYVTAADIGHTLPKMMMINGAIIQLKTYNNQGEISFELK